MLKPGGILITTAQPPDQEKALRSGVRAQFIITHPSAAALEEIARLVEDGKLRPVIGATFPLAEARKVHEGKGGKGNTLLRVNG